MDIEQLKNLTAPEARLLSLLLYLGNAGKVLPKKETMRLAGITDSGNYYKARRGLEQKGFVQVVREVVTGVMIPVSSAGTERSGVTDRLIHRDDCSRSNLSIYLSSTIPPQPPEPVHREGSVEGTLPPTVDTTPGDVEGTLGDVDTTPGTVEGTLATVEGTPGSVDTTPPSLYERCQEVDAMDDAGDIRDVRSPFGIRRKAQYPLMKEIWQKFFPGQLIPVDSSLRTFLQLCDNNVSTFHDAVELAVSSAKKPIEAPVAFIRKVLENKKNQPAPRPTPPRPQAKPFTSAARPMAPTVEKGDPITADELIADTPEFKRQREEFRKKYANFFAEDDE